MDGILGKCVLKIAWRSSLFKIFLFSLSLIINDYHRCLSLVKAELQPLNEIEDKIVKCLKEARSKDLSVTDIAKKVGVNRLTASKYLAVLQARGIVILSRNVGRAKMFQLSQKHAGIEIGIKGEGRKVRIEFLEKWFHYRPGTKVLLDEEQARELIKSGFAKEIKN